MWCSGYITPPALAGIVFPFERNKTSAIQKSEPLSLDVKSCTVRALVSQGHTMTDTLCLK